MAKRGRPVGTTKKDPRDFAIQLRLNAEEQVLIDSAARYEGMTATGFVRRAALLAARNVAEKETAA